MQLINIGFGNIVSANRIISIVNPDSAPIKRLVQEAKDSKMAVDATSGRRTRMKYDEVTSVVEFLTQNLNSAFKLTEGEENDW